MKKNIPKKGDKYKNWTLTSVLGRGGNGIVWLCKDDKGKSRAIKFLINTQQKRYDRFKDELYVIERNKNLKGILHPISKYLPKDIKKDLPYYVMPIAQQSFKKLKGRPIEDKVNAILNIAIVLKELHKKEISHRDIKPANILYINKNFVLSDFGLVDYPTKKDISSIKEEIGPKWTMAPEMRREAYKSDGVKADIYSLAKTLWIILTENQTGFDGQYSIDSIIELKKNFRDTYTTPIDDLLIKCTDNDPNQRPDIDEFIKSLNEWKKLNSDFHLSNRKQWFELQTRLFPTAIPQRVIWERFEDIIKILKILSSIKALNHLFFPESGGLDLKDVRPAAEDGCIELDMDLIDIIKPKRLIFESFDTDPQWNYFRLEADELEPSGVYSEEYYEEAINENLSEIAPGEYDEYDIVEYREFYEASHNLTDFSRQVTRWFSGSFVIFCKRSTYNLDPSTYDGRHDKMSTDDFREYIQENINRLSNG